MKPFTDEERQNKLFRINFDLANNKEIAMDANAIDVDLDTPIFRIYSYQRFLDLLNTKLNALVQPSMWEDPFENMLYNVEYYKVINGKKIPVDVSGVRDQWFGQCWTDRNDECDGLWRVYSNNKQHCVRVKSTVRKMFEPLYDFSKESAFLRFFVGKVQYDAEQDIVNLLKSFANAFITDTKNLCQVKTLLTKRKEFSYESEIRLLYNDLENNSGQKIHPYQIEPNASFEEIMLDPWCTDAEFSQFEAEIKSLGFYGSIIKSTLYKPIEINVFF